MVGSVCILYEVLFSCSIDHWAQMFGDKIYSVCSKATGLTDLQTVSTCSMGRYVVVSRSRKTWDQP